MTKKQRIAELERRVKELRREIVELRQERFDDARPPYPPSRGWVYRREIDDPVPWYPVRLTTGTPLPEPPSTTICAADVTHSVLIGPHVTVGFPSVGEPNGTITSLL